MRRELLTTMKAFADGFGGAILGSLIYWGLACLSNPHASFPLGSRHADGVQLRAV